jgi:hypothetical protein
VVSVATCLASIFQLCPTLSRADDPKGLEFFEKNVRPVLATHCFSCHSADAKKLKGGLRLDSRDAVLKGGDNGPAVVPGDVEKSRLLDALGYENVELQMPPKGKLPDDVIADLTAWVRMGAPWPAEAASNTKAPKTFNIEERRSSHWAWRPVKPTDPPMVHDASWPRGSADRFILAALESKGLTPASPADRRSLIRRLTFDLIGLPPAPDDVEHFVKDTSPDAIEKVVDRLLASPHFGERWARHWLDLVRYADGRGHEFDFTIPNAYQYRDYVVRAFNEDVPYNQFVVEHLAGDLLHKPRVDSTGGINESILGTGFWFLGEGVHSPVDIRQDEADRFDNMIDVISKTFLGLTVSCARCHDHKFDAISTKDYYALYGFLKSSSYRQVRFDTLEQQRGVAKHLEHLREETGPAIRHALVKTVQPGIRRTAEYLLGVHEVLQASEMSRKLRRSRVRWNGELLREIAESRNLDAAVLGRWVAEVSSATNMSDVLYPWAKICGPTTLKSLRKASPQGDSRIQNEIIVDYGALQPNQWLPDEFAWGSRPAQPGDVRMGVPISFVERAAAEIQPIWRSAKVAPGAEGEPTGFGGIIRAGRTIRTPSFTIDPSGRLQFLVKGTGRAYVAVGSYVLFDGPLHKNLLQPIKAGKTFRWVGSNDLSAYAGQTAHVEFTAGEDFAVAMVTQGTTPPSDDRIYENGILPIFAARDVRTAESVPAAYQNTFVNVADRLATEGIKDTNHARIANWLIRNVNLFATSADVKEFEDTLASLAAPVSRLTDELRKPSHLAPAMWDGTGVDEQLFIRGSHKARGETVPRRFLEALAGPNGIPTGRGSGRIDLAMQITDPLKNPFIARVMANRVWHHLFGRGIVPSVDDFGAMGSAPTHPELLDFLADRFVKDGWSVKELIRALVLSQTYQMSCETSTANDAIDSANDFLHRMRVRRLEAEAIRDAALAVSGRLETRLYGKSVPVHLTEFQQGRGRPKDSGPLDGNGRRSLYLRVPRNFQTPMMLALDSPAPASTIGKRSVSNVPAQALILMNDPFVHDLAERWAKNVIDRYRTTDQRVAMMYIAAFSRSPTAEECEKCKAFVESRVSDERSNEQSAWADLAHVLLNTKEFIYLR